jgi:rod shape-determining protein MreC
MESVLSRYKNLITLVVILFAQVLGLAIQVKRTSESESNRLIRIWAVSAVTPFEKAINWVQNGTWNIWHNYFYLRGVRAENRALKAQIEQLRLEQARLGDDAAQARRLQALLAFKEQYIEKTVPAQVIGTSGSEQSRSVFIDKGKHDGIEPNMAVITADGIVGKVLTVFPTTSQVLLISDQSSGAGGILEKSRLQGIVKGTSSGQVVLEYVMSDEQVQPGDRVLTSGGDGIYPKGLPVGEVTKVSPGHELFLNIRLQPAANLAKLEEVLVITEVISREPSVADEKSARAVDVLAQRLPSVPEKPADDAATKAASPDATKPPAAASARSAAGDAAKPSVKPNSAKPEAESGSPRIAETSSAPSLENTGAAAAKPATPKPATAKPATEKPATEKPATVNPATPGSTANSSQPKPAAPAKPKPVAPAVPKTTPVSQEAAQPQ